MSKSSCAIDLEVFDSVDILKATQIEHPHAILASLSTHYFAKHSSTDGVTHSKRPKKGLPLYLKKSIGVNIEKDI